MFLITYQDEMYRNWHCEYVFHSFYGAKEYLLNKGFTEKQGLFHRENYNWSKYIKAHINPVKAVDMVF